MQKLYTALLSFALLASFSSVQAQLPPGAPPLCADGSNNSSATYELITPPAPDGTYEAGQVVEMCINIGGFASTGANWLHGLMIDFPAGWDLSTMNVTAAPPSCTNNGGGNWDWYESVTSVGSGLTYGPGFYYDANSGNGGLDGNPGNNYGDPCGLNFNIQGCFELTLAADCGGPGNPFDNLPLAPTIYFLGDGDSGSWTTESLCIPYITAETPQGVPIDISLNCCDANAGASPGTLPICENGTICMIDLLTDNPDGGGFWTGPAGWVSDGTDCGNFDPTSDPAGDYTYTVFGTGGCDNSATITFQFQDLGELESIVHCDPGFLSLMDEVCIPNGIPITGTWYDPNGNPVPVGLVNPAAGLVGSYLYEFYDSNNCFTTLTAAVLFSPLSSGGVDSSMDLCNEEAVFIPFDHLDGNPAAGGNWIEYEIVGLDTNFVNYYLLHDVELDPSNYTDDFVMTYVLGAFPCPDLSYTDLSVTVHELANTGIPTTTSICITDPPTSLISLLDEDGNGPVDAGWTWTDLTGDPTLPPLTDPIDPSIYPVNTTLQLLYEGGLPGSLCVSSSLLTLTILPADADAGLDANIDICETDASFNMTDTLNGSPQPGGQWTDPNGNPVGNVYTPGSPATPPGIYTYTVTSSCDSDFATLTVTEFALPDVGISNAAIVCDSDGNVDLTSLLGGTPAPGGAWTETGTGNPVANPYNVTGQCGPTALNFTYTLSNTACTNSSTLALTIECPPEAGSPVSETYCADGSVLDLFTILAPDADGSGTFTPSNTVVLNAGNSDVFTYTVTGANCPADFATYTIDIIEGITAVTTTACEANATEYIPTVTISGGTPPYTIDGTNTGGPVVVVGNTYVGNAILEGTNYSFTISDSGPCGDILEAGTSPVCPCNVTADFSPGNLAVCAGNCTNIPVTAVGTPPFTVTYFNGVGNQTATLFTNNEPISVCPGATTTYTIVGVEDANCIGTAGNTSVVVTVEPVPNAGADDALDYCGDGSPLNLFSVLDPAADLTGTWNPTGNITLDPVFSGVYTYTVNGAGNCTPDQATYTINIDPEISATIPTTTCTPDQTQYVVEFVVSGGVPFGAGAPYTVVGNNGGSFAGNTYTSQPIDENTPFSFTISDDGECPDIVVSGMGVDCVCTATASITSGNTGVCEGDCTDLEFTASNGTPPFTIDFTDGTNNYQTILPGLTGTFEVCPTVNSTYTITNVQDANCVGTPSGASVTVTVETPPNAGPDVPLSYCGDGTFLNLASVLDPSADPTGFWSPGSIVELIPANSGNYVYQVNGTNCPNDQATYTLTIEPEIVANVLASNCEPNQTEYTIDIEVTGGAGIGSYTITDNANGTVGGFWTGNVYTTGVIPVGNAYNFTISSTGDCPDVTVVGPTANCSCAATATFNSSNVTICEGTATNLEIITTGDAPFIVGVSDGSVTTPVNVFGSPHLYPVNPLVTTTYTIVSVEDANCVGTAFGSVTVTVEQQKEAGSNVIVPDLCGDGTQVNLFDYLAADADPSGSFNPPNPFAASPAAAGVYTYTVTGTECPNDQALYTVNIDEVLSISNLNLPCELNQTEYTVTFEISGGTGPGTYTVTGGLGGTVSGNLFTSNIIPMGTGYSFTIDDGGPCPAIIEGGGSPNCNCAATANITSGPTTVCANTCTDIEITSSGTPPFTIVYNDGTADIPINTNDFVYYLEVCPAVTTTYSLVSINDVNCEGTASGNVTITADPQLEAGSPGQLVACGDGSFINLFDHLEADANAGGSFDVPQPMEAIPANSGVYTYTVGGNACPDDIALYTVTFDEPISVSNVLFTCNSNQIEYEGGFIIAPATGTYTVTGTGITTPLSIGAAEGYTVSLAGIDFATNPNYSFTISSDNSSCPDYTFTDIAPDCNCIAQGQLTGSTTICAGDPGIIELVALGDGPFTITYESTCAPGVPTTLVDVPNGHIITTFENNDCTYTLTSIFDQYCEGTITGSPVTINVDQPIVATAVNEVIDNNNENFQVVINLQGGDPSTYNFIPAGGVYDNISGVYTSAPIPCGNGYSITIGDAGVCDPLVVQEASFDCGCVSESGTIANNPQDVCIDGSISVFHAGDEVMDGNDVLQFILHDGAGATIGNVIGRTYDGVFDMNNYAVTADETYCIVAAVGTADFSGNVDLNDDCTSFSLCLPVTIRPLPTGTIIGGAAVCPGETVDIVVQLTGTAEWNFEYALNGQSQGAIPTTSASNTLTVSQPGDYTLLNVNDNFCSGTIAGTATVLHHAIPTATMSGDPEVCEGSGDGPVVDFTGTPPFTFTYTLNGVAQDPGTSNSFTHVIPAEEDGLYVITSVEDNNCTGNVSGDLNVTIVERPTATISGGGEICDGDESQFIVYFTGTAPWDATYTVDGVGEQIYSEQPTYQFDSGLAGDYEITLVSDDKCNGDVIDSDVSLIVNPLPTAELEASTTAFCIGEEIEVGIVLDGVPPFNVTYVMNNDTTIIEGLLSSTSQLMTPDGPVIAEILYVEDGSNPTCSSTPLSSIYVDAGTLANAPVLSDDSLCTDNGPKRIGVNSAPGLSYQWSPEDYLSDPTVANPIFTPPADIGPFAKTITYTLTATNGDCSAIDTMTVKVDPGPNARFDYSPDPVWSEDTEVHFNNNTIGSDNMVYFWEFDTLDTSQDENPIYRFPDGVNDSYDITLTVIDFVSGCMDVRTELLTIQPEMLIYVPNAFTPDGDGLNDLWAPVMQNIDADNYKLSVYDRFGSLVFETTNVDQKWNGSINDGDYYAKEGVYIWMIETKNSITLDEEEFKGKVTLIR